MTLYANAVAAIRESVEVQQAKLDRAAKEAREDNISAHRKAATAGLSPDSPAWHVGQLVANTLSIGRELDGYPQFSTFHHAARRHSATRLTRFGLCVITGKALSPFLFQKKFPRPGGFKVSMNHYETVGRIVHAGETS